MMDKIYKEHIGLAVPLAFFIAIIFVYRDYGITWDEPSQVQYGIYVLDYFLSGFRDSNALTFGNTRFYSPGFELLWAAANYPSGYSALFEVHHLLTALASLFGVIGIIHYAKLFDKPLLPFFSPLFLVLMPRFWGHSFIDSKDIPFAAFFIWTMVYITKIAMDKGLRARHIWLCGLFTGLTLSVRLGIFNFIALLLALALICRYTSLTAFLIKLLTPLIIGWAIMVSVWPWAHLGIISNPLSAIKFASNFPETYDILFEGKVIRSDNLPWYYVIRYILITVPPVTLLSALAGAVSGLHKENKERISDRHFLYLFTLLWFILPIAYVIIFHPNIYDEIRHFIFIMPALAVFAGIGASGIYGLLNSGKSRRILSAVLLLITLLPIAPIIKLHPYQVTYFNIFAGGIKGADRNYETDYWMSSYKEAMEWIVKEAPKTGRVSVLVAGYPHTKLCAGYYASDNISLTVISDKGVKGNLPEGIDYYIATYRYGWMDNFPDAAIAHTIGRDGAIFTVIKRRS